MGKKIAIALLILCAAAGAFFYYHSVVVGKRAEYHDTVFSPSAKNSSGATTPGATAPVPAEPIAKPTSTPPVAAAPFSPRPGESLEFAANVPKLNSTIATIKLLVGDKQNIAGRNAAHFQALAHTENPYRMIFELDDRFDSFSDPAAAMASLQYEMHLSERGQKSDSVERMLPSVKDPAPPDASAARVLPGTRDPLGLLHYLRGVDWTKTPEVHGPVFDGRKLYEARANLAAKSVPVSVPAGSFNASKIEIHVFDNGTEMKDAHFFLYLSNDPTRIPVLLEAVLPVATARVELTKHN